MPRKPAALPRTSAEKQKITAAAIGNEMHGQRYDLTLQTGTRSYEGIGTLFLYFAGPRHSEVFALLGITEEELR